MDLGVFARAGLFFINLLFTAMPTDFIVTGLSETDVPLYFNTLLQFLAQWDFIFPVLMMLKIVALVLGLLLIKFGLSVIRYLANMVRGAGA